MKAIGIGVDIGGSHIYCAAVDLATYAIILGTKAERKINNKASADEILTGWSETLADTMSSINNEYLSGIAFAMPGPFNYPEGIALFERVEKYENLYGVNVTSEIRRRLRLDDNTRIRYINDATAFAIAESWVGKAGRYDRVIALTLGTGFGSAFIRDGVPVLEGDEVPEMGCVWHLPYKDGIANNYFSTPWFVNSYRERTGRSVAGVQELADVAHHDRVALSLFREYGRGMGQFLAPWIRKFDAKVIVIGGNITGAFSLFGDCLIGELNQNSVKTEVLISDLKEDAAVIGSTRLLDDNYFEKVKDLLSRM